MRKKLLALLMVLSLLAGPCLLNVHAEGTGEDAPSVITNDEGNETPDNNTGGETPDPNSGSEMPGDSTGDEKTDAGSDDKKTDDGTGNETPDGGDDKDADDSTGSEIPDGGTDDKNPDEGTGSETPDGGTGGETPDGGTDDKDPDDSTGGEKPDDGKDPENPGGTTECTHSFGKWSVSGDSHSRVCESCGEKEEGKHTPDAGTVTVEATCLQKGSITYRCTVCGANKIEVLEKTDHTFSYDCDAVCDVCTLIREVEHTANPSWSKDSGGHWHVCRICGEKLDDADHYPGPAATEEKDQICLTCGYIMTPKRTHTHKYETRFTYDETGHWYACSGCEEKKEFAAHKLANDCEAGCEVCGYKGAAVHSYDDTWGSDETGHWPICQVCGKPDKVQNHIPGPEATELKAQLCTVCDYELTPVRMPETTETEPAEQWQSDAQSHWMLGSSGEKQQEASHTWGKGIDRWDGAVVYTCTVCQAERVETELPDEEEEKGFNWAIVLLIVLILLFAATVVVLVLMLKKYGNPFAKLLKGEEPDSEEPEFEEFDSEMFEE